MADVNESLKRAMDIKGAIGAALVDSASGMVLGVAGGGADFNVEVAAAGNTEVVRAKLETMRSLNLDDVIEDILVSLGTQYHLIRLLKKSAGDGAMFLYLATHKAQSNLAMSRMELEKIEADLVLN